jgi:hypothetical protein
MTELVRGEIAAAPGEAVKAEAGNETGLAPAIIAEFTDYSSLHVALRVAREARNISLDTLDKLAGAPDRYCSRILAPNSERRITMEALGWLFAGLGVKAILVDDPDTLELAQPRMNPRNQKVVRGGAVTITLSRRFLSKIGRKGAAARNAQRMKRKAAARHAANARWNKNQ